MTITLIVLAVTIALLFASNMAWLLFLNQFDFAGDTTTQEAEGDANYIGNNGDITNGESINSSLDSNP